MRLARILLVVVIWPGLAWADGEASLRVTLFKENSKTNEGVSVLHPQANVSDALLPSLRLSAGYDADIVSGATPAIYGPQTGPDAVTGATKFTDDRHAAHGGFEHTYRTLTFSGAYEYAREKDYRSHAISIGARGDLWDRNLTLGLAYTHNFDSVCTANNQTAQGPLDLRPLPSSQHCYTSAADVDIEPLNIDSFEPTLAWTATPRLLIEGGGTLQILDGFQSNPYRSVLVGNQHRTPLENHPRHRQRYAAFLRAAYAFPQVRASVSVHGRVYRDTWDLRSATAEVTLQKYVGRFLLAQAQGRYYRQSGAVFYRTGIEYMTKGPAGQYWTGDRELSPMTNLLVGGRFAYLHPPQEGGKVLGIFEDLELAVRFDFLSYGLDSVGAPNSDRTAAYIAQTGFECRF